MVPEDVMLNILSRLPTKSLTRYKCVSEVWLALIENPDFFSKNLLNHSIFATTKSPGPPILLSILLSPLHQKGEWCLRM
ncbi:f-box/kelch-repeat protein [Fagus crenata]